MHVRTRPSPAGEQGFTMVELLVVFLIVGILTMIALPAFIGQRTKGHDTEAQQTLRTVATALAARHTDTNSYDATRADLERIEPAIGEATGALFIDGYDDGYTIREQSASNTVFTLQRNGDGTITRSCSIAGRGLCNAANRW
jgi:prepilin-type N-terminal cleavage/methylation domain-containing protein